jgi:chromosome segregation ATPase
MNHENQKRLDSLSELIGTEQSTRDRLAVVDQRLAELSAEVEPLEDKRQELLDRLDAIETAKAEAANIKTADRTEV